MHASASAERSRRVSSRSAQPARSRHAMRTMCRLRKRRSASITSASLAPLHPLANVAREPVVSCPLEQLAAANQLAQQLRAHAGMQSRRTRCKPTRAASDSPTRSSARISCHASASCSRAACNRASMSVNSRRCESGKFAPMDAVYGNFFADDGVAPTPRASNLLRCIAVLRLQERPVNEEFGGFWPMPTLTCS